MLVKLVILTGMSKTLPIIDKSCVEARGDLSITGKFPIEAR